MNTYTITWTDPSGFEKTWEVQGYSEAIRIVGNPEYFPIEISNYSEMTAYISSDGNIVDVFKFN